MEEDTNLTPKNAGKQNINMYIVKIGVHHSVLIKSFKNERIFLRIFVIIKEL